MHSSVQSMRARAFEEGRCAFDSDDEYRRALNGEFDGVREDFSYEANEDPDDGEDPEDLSNDEAEVEKKDLEDEQKDKFFDDVLPGILADRRHGAEFLDFIVGGSGAAEPSLLAPLQKAATEVLQVSEQLWLVHDRSGFRLERLDKARQAQVPVQVPATWDEEEFLEKLREVAWDDPDAGDFLLGGGGVKGARKALDDLRFDEMDDGFVVETVDGFLDNVRSSREEGSARARTDADVTGGTGYGDAGRVDMTLEWSVLAPDAARLTVSEWSTAVDREEDSFLVPLAFLRWWKFCRERGW